MVYFVPPFHDVPRAEPVLDLRAMTPVGGLASTARDLARWSAFVASPPDEVLSPDTLEEMFDLAEQMEFEKAATVRDRIKDLEQLALATM